MLVAAVEWESVKFRAGSARQSRAAPTSKPSSRGACALPGTPSTTTNCSSASSPPNRAVSAPFAGVDDRIHAAITGFFLPEVLALEPAVDPGWVADHLARLLVSYIGTAGLWDVDDDAQLRNLVRTQFLAAFLGLGSPPRLDIETKSANCLKCLSPLT